MRDLFGLLLMALLWVWLPAMSLAGPYEDWRDATELMKKSDFKGAIPLYDRVIASKAYAGIHLGQLHAMRGKAKLQAQGFRMRLDADGVGLQYDEPALKSAQSDLTEAIRLNPRDHGAYIDRGASYAMLRQYDAALADFTTSISIKPDFMAYNNRCLALEKLGRKDEAIADCRKALELNPGYWQTKSTLERLGVR